MLASSWSVYKEEDVKLRYINKIKNLPSNSWVLPLLKIHYQNNKTTSL